MPVSVDQAGGTRHDQATDRRFLTLADEWITRTAGGDGASWFRAAIRTIENDPRGDALATAIGMAPRRLGKADLLLSSDDAARAAGLRAGLDPGDWSVDQLARIALMLASHAGDDEAFAAGFSHFCETAELNELIALCRGLPLYPAPRLLEQRAREAVRSGMKPVFEAVAHRNPYPADVFADDAWNQMVVKAFFIGSALWPIQALDRRANPALARMLVGLAQERWAAGRPVSAELWRCVAPHADEAGMSAVIRVLRTGADKERLAVALALQQAPADKRDAVRGAGLRAELETLERRLTTESIDWKRLV